jgi:hypothetical protein
MTPVTFLPLETTLNHLPHNASRPSPSPKPTTLLALAVNRRTVDPNPVICDESATPSETPTQREDNRG